MSFLKRTFKSDPTNDFAANETTAQTKYPKTIVKVLPLSESDFEYMLWRRRRACR